MSDVVNGLHAGNPINDANQSAPGRSTGFPLVRKFAQTVRFGELTPNLCMNCVPDDKIKLNLSTDLTSYTFKAPLMQSMSLKKDYYSVPMEAILPNQWSRIYANPNMGDDVPSDAYTSIDLVSKVIDLQSYISNEIQAMDPKDQLLTGLEYFIFLESIFSDGSLLANLGCHLSNCLYFDDEEDRWTIDEAIDFISSKLTNLQIRIPHGSGYKNYFLSRAKDLRSFLEYVRDNGVIDPNTIVIGDYSAAVSHIVNFIVNFVRLHDPQKPIDLSRAHAYQIVCAHFYSNDRVDYIYSAELYRQNLWSCLYEIFDQETFEYNGLDLPYDFASAHYIAKPFVTPDMSCVNLIFKYFALVLGFRHSLRYVDYFTGAKTRPLAIGDTSVDVNNQSVDVVDVTRNIQLQRFLNAVNRSGRKISDYVKGLFGINQAHDFHNPMYLYHTSDVIYGDRTSNTGSDQLVKANSVTQVMTSNSGNQFFEFSCDRPCIVIGIQYFDIERLYSSTIEKFFFHKDRFDMFNPYMEFIGDQAIDGAELSPETHQPTFGYTTRYMEYKQVFSSCAGGFKKYLPGYAFIAENTSAITGLVEDHTISPSFIRSQNTELDDFYVSLTGFSLASYFHFIEVNNFNVSANRPMAWNPNIL